MIPVLGLGSKNIYLFIYFSFVSGYVTREKKKKKKNKNAKEIAKIFLVNHNPPKNWTNYTPLPFPRKMPKTPCLY